MPYPSRPLPLPGLKCNQAVLSGIEGTARVTFVLEAAASWHGSITQGRNATGIYIKAISVKGMLKGMLTGKYSRLVLLCAIYWR